MHETDIVITRVKIRELDHLIKLASNNHYKYALAMLRNARNELLDKLKRSGYDIKRIR